MSDVNEVIGRLRAAAGFQGRYPVLHREAAEALAAEHAEVERLHGELSDMRDRVQENYEAAKRFKVERDALTAQLQAVREWMMVNEIAPVPLDWAGLGAILDAAADSKPECPQPCIHLSAEDARDGKTCSEHPCTCRALSGISVDGLLAAAHLGALPLNQDPAARLLGLDAAADEPGGGQS